MLPREDISITRDNSAYEIEINSFAGFTNVIKQYTNCNENSSDSIHDDSLAMPDKKSKFIVGDTCRHRHLHRWETGKRRILEALCRIEFVDIDPGLRSTAVAGGPPPRSRAREQVAYVLTRSPGLYRRGVNFGKNIEIRMIKKPSGLLYHTYGSTKNN